MLKEKNKIINCHSEEALATEESGRSMVEMLGVLAVIGVLSVVGIAGFKNAMDKNKANTVINEAQKRATLVVPQIQLQNSANPTLTEFNNNNLGYATFDTKVYTKSDNLPEGQFGIKVSNVSKEICQNILITIGDNTVIRRLSTESAPTTALTSCDNTNTFLLIYNNDMTTNPVAGEFSDKKSCTNAGFVYNNGQCANDMCATCTAGQDCLTVAGEKKCVSACPSGQTRDEETGTCTNNKCTDNSNCSPIDGITSFCYTESGICDKNTEIWVYRVSAGYCRKITDMGDPNSSALKKTVDGFGTLVRSSVRMTRDAGYNWCQALGKNLIDISGSKLMCYDGENLIDIGENLSELYCCSKNKTCNKNDKSTWSDKMRKLNDAFGSFRYGLWTGTLQSSCTAYFLYIPDGVVRSNVRECNGAGGYYYPLCED